MQTYLIGDRFYIETQVRDNAYEITAVVSALVNPHAQATWTTWHYYLTFNDAGLCLVGTREAYVIETKTHKPLGQGA